MDVTRSKRGTLRQHAGRKAKLERTLPRSVRSWDQTVYAPGRKGLVALQVPCISPGRRLGQAHPNRDPNMAQSRAPRVSFVSLGCPKALVDSERIITRLRAEGYELTPAHAGADLAIVNTCGV